MICVDASVAAKWVLPEQHSWQALDLYERVTRAGQEVVAPLLLPIEVSNIVRQRVRRGLLAPTDSTRALHGFLDFQVRLAASQTLSQLRQTAEAWLAYGVEWVWILVEARTVEVCGADQPATLGENDTLAGEGPLSGFAVPVAELFAS